MNTIGQVRSEFYNAILADTNITNLISDRLYWINRITVENDFPLVTYQYFDTSGEYSFDDTGVNRVADNIVFQTNIYVSPQNISDMDTLVENLKTALNAIGYRNINAPIEFLDSEIQMNVRPMRWEKWNV